MVHCTHLVVHIRLEEELGHTVAVKEQTIVCCCFLSGAVCAMNVSQTRDANLLRLPTTQRRCCGLLYRTSSRDRSMCLCPASVATKDPVCSAKQPHCATFHANLLFSTTSSASIAIQTLSNPHYDAHVSRPPCYSEQTMMRVSLSPSVAQVNTRITIRTRPEQFCVVLTLSE